MSEEKQLPVVFSGARYVVKYPDGLFMTAQCNCVPPPTTRFVSVDAARQAINREAAQLARYGYASEAARTRLAVVVSEEDEQ